MARNRALFRTLLFVGIAALAAGCGKEKVFVDGPERIIHDPAPAPAADTSEPWTRSGQGPATEYYGGSLTTVQVGHFLGQVPDSRKPWSGYWYKLGQTTMDENGNQVSILNGPLTKYDQWVKAAHNETSNALGWFNDNQDDVTQGWEGLCNAWAAASILSPEPLADAAHGKTVNGVNFTVADLKALTVLSYENLPAGTLRTIGARFDGGPADDYQDLYPDQFHRILQEELFKKQQAFIIDNDPSYPIWNYPVFWSDIVIVADAADPHVLHVTTNVVWADDAVDPGFVGTREINRTYYYDLFGVMTTAADGSQSFEVHAGKWIGNSVKDHPDFATLVVDRARGESANPRIKSNYIDEILK